MFSEHSRNKQESKHKRVKTNTMSMSKLTKAQLRIDSQFLQGMFQFYFFIFKKRLCPIHKVPLLQGL